MLAQELSDTAVQICVTLAFALVAFVFFGRKRGGFLKATGLILPTAHSLRIALVHALFVIPFTLFVFRITPVGDLALSNSTVASRIMEYGFSVEAALVVLVVALFKTALSEEIIFRGVIAKILIAKIGLLSGNILHAVGFGVLHITLFMLFAGGQLQLWAIALIFSLTTFGSWILAHLNESVGNGSIVPSWILHGLTNVAAFAFGFVGRGG